MAMTLDLSTQDLLVLCDRLGRELGASQVGGFALEGKLMKLELEFAAVSEREMQANANVQALREKLIASEAEVEKLRQQADPARAEKMERFTKSKAARTP